jgi:UDP-glucose:(glucosyl)LPS alpha-1,2-glucosyltransferase
MNNFDLMESNEISSKAMGGTEMYMRFLYDGTVPRHLLENVQIIPSRLSALKEDKIRIWFEHNLPNDPESMRALKDPEMRSKFHKVVFVSNWHYQSFMNFCGVPYSTQNCVMEGGMQGIEPSDQNPSLPKKSDPQKQVNITYHTTPHRGLELLVPVFLKLAESDKNIHLHVHSSFKMYGWDARDQPYEPLYDICRQHPQITYHGFTKYEDLVPKLRDEYHIFAYPNIWPETMCRSIVESMYYGLVCVHPDLAAITDTTGGLNRYMYNGTLDREQHMKLHYSHLQSAIADVREGSGSLTGSLQFNREYVQRRYGTGKVYRKWTSLLQELNDQYPTVESRAFPKKYFTYRTG